MFDSTRMYLGYYEPDECKIELKIISQQELQILGLRKQLVDILSKEVLSSDRYFVLYDYFTKVLIIKNKEYEKNIATLAHNIKFDLEEIDVFFDVKIIDQN